jgi:hypothetical protein
MCLVIVGVRGSGRRRLVHATERNRREQGRVKQLHGDEQWSDEQRNASMKEERAVKNREDCGWESIEGIAEFEREFEGIAEIESNGKQKMEK